MAENDDNFRGVRKALMPATYWGRVAVVTGGGQGIRRQYALSLARAGAIPVIWVQALDVSDIAACERMAERVTREFGRIDVLVSGAQIFRRWTKLRSRRSRSPHGMRSCV